MADIQSAVLFMEEAVSSESGKPLMLEKILDRPILSWMSNHLLTGGVGRIFVVCPPQFAEEAKACLPVEMTATISELQSELMAFLNTPDSVLVLNRSAIPMAEAGPGFAYAAPGYALQDTWRVKMTNSVQEAQLVSGWLPVFGPDTVAELETLLRERGVKNEV